MLAYFIEETEILEGSGICSNSMAVTNDMAGLKLRSAWQEALGQQVLFGPHRVGSWHSRKGAGWVYGQSPHPNP